jgi:DNA-binding helix-hairpin-helix protein with protein kinase domain
VGADAGTFEVDKAKLQEVVRRLNACVEVNFEYDPDLFAPTEPLEPEPLPEGVEDHPNVVIVLAVAIGVCLLGLPLGLLHWAFAAGGLLGSLVFGGWLGLHYALSPWHQEYRRRRRARELALDAVGDAEDAWQRHVQHYRQEHYELGQSIRALVAGCRGLAVDYQAEFRRLAADAETLARLRHMRLHLIADAEIPNIGEKRKQVLASHQVFTANDIEYHVIRGIKGFGDVLTGALLQWKEEVLRQFRFNAATAISPPDQTKLATKFRTNQNQLLTEMDRQLTKLSSLAGACHAALQQLVPILQRVLAERRQTEVDLQVFE